MTTVTTERRITEADITAAYAHPAIFLSQFAYIHDPNKPELGAFKWDLWPWQFELLDLFVHHKRIIILKARQLGCSWLFAGYALWLFLTHPGSVIILLSIRESEAAELLRKCVYIYEHLPPEFRFTVNRKDSDTTTRFSSHVLGSEIIAMASAKNAARSRTATLVIPDEWAIQEYASEMYSSYEPTIGQNGQIIGGSTAMGAGGFFYDMWNAAKKRVGGFLPVFLPWNLRPDRSQEWYDEKKAQLEAEGNLPLLYQEFPSDELEAFASSVSRFFPLEVVRSFVANIRPPIETLMEGKWRVYKPASPFRRYVMGVDVSEAVVDGDYSTASVLDRATGEQVATFRGRIPPDIFALHLAEIGEYYNFAFIGVEANNHGILTLNTLLSCYPKDRIYHRPLHEKAAPLSPQTAATIPTIRWGWLTTTKSKPEALLNFRTACIDGSFSTPCQLTVNEMQYFTQHGMPPGKVTYSADKSHHDDLIMSTVIAWAMRSLPVGSMHRAYRETPSLSR